MKKHLLHWAAAMFAAASLTAVACSDDDPYVEPPVAPNFPTAVTASVEFNDSYALTIEPNQAWTVSIPDASREWFALDDNGIDASSVSGDAGRYTITVKTADREDYDEDHSVDLTMTMGTESQVIATLTIAKLERELHVYAAQVDDSGEFVLNEDEESSLYYAYDRTQPAAEVEMIAVGAFYMAPVLVESNVGWKLALPDWVNPVVNGETLTAGSAGVTEIELRADEELMPVEGETAEIRVLANTDEEIVLASFSVTFPNIADLLEVSVASELSYNTMGEYLTGSSVARGAIGSFTALEGARLFVVAEYDVNPYWVNITVDEWDATDKSPIQTLGFEISLSKNRMWSSERRGEIYVLPASAITEDFASDQMGDYALIDQSNGEVKSEYAQYKCATFTQASAEGPFSVRNPAVIGQEGAAFTFEYTEPSYLRWNDWMTNVDANYYKLVYTNPYAASGATLNVDPQYTYTSYKIYSYAAEVEEDTLDPDNNWLTVSEEKDDAGNVVRFTINMNFDDDYYNMCWMREGYVVFYDEWGTLATIDCVYDENASIGGGGDASLAFSYPEYAAMDGSTLVLLTEGELYDRYGDGHSPVYHLTFTQPSPTMSMLSGLTEYAFVSPSAMDWLSYEPGEYGMVFMDTTEPKTDFITFYTDNSYMTVAYILICTYAPAE